MVKYAWAFRSLNFAEAGGLGLGAFNDPGNWYIYVALAADPRAVIGAAVIGSGGLLGFWLCNRGEVAAGRTPAA